MKDAQNLIDASTAPLVTIIMTAYNFEQYIGPALTSLLTQEFEHPIELIVVDDCSTDCTVEKILALGDDRIQLIQNKQNKGAAANLNYAISLARGRYIGRFDGDDVWLPHFLRTTVKVLEQNPQIGLVYGDVAFIDHQGVILNPHSPVPNYNGWEKPALLQALLSDYLICAPSILARREAWALAFPLPEYLLYCDFEMTLCMATQWEFRYVPEVLAQYRLHMQNMHSTAIRHRRAEESIINTMVRFRQKNPALLSAAEWSNIYHQRYLQFGDQYFGVGDISEARRCYARGKAWLKIHSGYFHRWLATYIPLHWYNGLKKMIKASI